MFKEKDITCGLIVESSMLSQCGYVTGGWEVERVETINPNNVTCLMCRDSKRWKELMELDKQVSEIKEIEGDFVEANNLFEN